MSAQISQGSERSITVDCLTEQGHTLARLWLGSCYEHGQGDARPAMVQYRLAAESCCAVASASLGLRFEKGRGVPRSDAAEAAQLTCSLLLLWCAPGAQCAGSTSRLGLDTWPPQQQLKALAGRRDVVSACCEGCGAVRKLKMCSKCRSAVSRTSATGCAPRACGRRTRRAARLSVPNQRAFAPPAEAHVHQPCMVNIVL
jgi:hypothetical protein